MLFIYLTLSTFLLYFHIFGGKTQLNYNINSYDDEVDKFSFNIKNIHSVKTTNEMLLKTN